MKYLVKYSALTLLILGFQQGVKAQQDPHYTHWRYNKLSYNPAFAGFGNKHCLSAVARRQWMSLEEESSLYNTESVIASNQLQKSIGPKTNTITYGGILYGFDKRGNKDGIKDHSINGMFMFGTDAVAYENNTYIKVGLAGNYEFLDQSSIRLGVNYTSLSKSLNGSKLRAHDPNDPLIPVSDIASTVGTVDLGVYYSNPNVNKLWIGLSNTNLSKQQFQYANFQVTTARHFYLMSGMTFEDFFGPGLDFEPAVLLKTGVRNSPVTPQLDINGMVTYNDMFSGGLNIRGQSTGMDAISVLLGYYPPIFKGNGPNGDVKTLRVGYSYDVTLNAIRKVSAGTHEVQVNFCFPINIPPVPDRIKHNTIYMKPRPELKENNPKNF